MPLKSICFCFSYYCSVHFYAYTFRTTCYSGFFFQYFFFWIRGNPTPRKAHFVGPGEQVKPRLFQALTRGARPDSNSRPAVQISSPLPSRYTLWGLFFQYYSQASSINDYFCLFYSWFLR
jgi:hypothetical protein